MLVTMYDLRSLHLHSYDKLLICLAGLQFLSAQDTTYIWASHWGETRPQLEDGEGFVTDSGLVRYSYLGDRVVHYKAPGAGHGILNVDYGDEIKELIRTAILE